MRASLALRGPTRDLVPQAAAKRQLKDLRKKDNEDSKIKGGTGEAIAGALKAASRRVTQGSDLDHANGAAAEGANGGFWARWLAPTSRVNPTASDPEAPALVRRRAGQDDAQDVGDSFSGPLPLSDNDQLKLLTDPTILERKAMYDCHEVDYRFVRRAPAFSECVAPPSACARARTRLRPSTRTTAPDLDRIRGSCAHTLHPAQTPHLRAPRACRASGCSRSSSTRRCTA